MMGVAGDHSSACPTVEGDNDGHKAAPSYRVDELLVGGRAIVVDPKAQAATDSLEPVLLDEVPVEPRYLVRVLHELTVPAPRFTLEGKLDTGTATEVEPPAAAEDAQNPVEVSAALD
jgi:hypothetical protein